MFESDDLKAIAIIMIGTISLTALLMNKIDVSALLLLVSIIAGLAGYQIGLTRARRMVKNEA